VDHAHEERGRRSPEPVVHPKAPEPRKPEGDLLELQRTAGNQAVARALATVQRHTLDPEQMDEG
jgi:hypothetical protein